MDQLLENFFLENVFENSKEIVIVTKKKINMLISTCKLY